MRNAKVLLEKLTEWIPPGEGQRHNLTLNTETGQMELTLMVGDNYVPFIIEGSDLRKDAEVLGQDILKLYRENFD